MLLGFLPFLINGLSLNVTDISLNVMALSVQLKLEIKAGLLGALEYLLGSCTSQVGPPAGLVSYPLVPFWPMEY
jgi:hypothetical protein